MLAVFAAGLLNVKRLDCIAAMLRSDYLRSHGKEGADAQRRPAFVAGG
jgi:hypothetical protein